jgi:hypothetical protein
MSTRLVPFVLFFLLCAITATPAAAVETPLGDLPVLAFEEEEELEAEAAAEEVEEECEEVEEEVEEECEEVESKAERAALAREECVLRTARAHAALDRRGEKLKLTIGYTAYEPANAKIKVGHIATLNRHLGRSGVLRIVKALRKGQHLKRLVVRINLPSVRSAGCPSRRLVLFPR